MDNENNETENENLPLPPKLDLIIPDTPPVECMLHMIIGISNPCLYESRYTLARQFIRRMRKMPNVLLYIVEIAYDLPGKPPQEFRLTKSWNPYHLQVRSADPPLWAKENMWNMGVRHLLPRGWKTVACCDADVQFENIQVSQRFW